VLAADVVDSPIGLRSGWTWLVLGAAALVLVPMVFWWLRGSSASSAVASGSEGARTPTRAKGKRKPLRPVPDELPAQTMRSPTLAPEPPPPSVQVRLAAGAEAQALAAPALSDPIVADAVPNSSARPIAADAVAESGAFPSAPKPGGDASDDEPVSFFIDDLDAAPATRQASIKPSDEPA
jgi:hypothetical protein